MKAFHGDSKIRSIARGLVISAAFTIGLFAVSCAQQGTQLSLNPAPATFPKAVAEKVSHLSQGIIAPDDSIVLRLTEAAQLSAAQKSVSTSEAPAEGLFSFNPPIEGKASWADAQTLVFKPAKSLPLRTNYQASVALGKMLADSPVETLDFSFATSGREITGLTASFACVKEGDPSQIRYSGSLGFSLPASLDTLKSAFKASYGGESIPVTVVAGADDSSFSFQTMPMERGAEKKLFSLKIDGKALDLSADLSREIPIEALGSFSLQGARAIPDGNQSTLVLDFSDELSDTQDPRGFISVEPKVDFSLSRSGRSLSLSGAFMSGTSYKLRVQGGLKNQYGYALPVAAEVSVTAEDIKPEIAFMQSGAFLTSVGDGRVHFRTINVKRVYIDVVQVYDNNLGQFLQTEQMNSKSTRKEEFNYSYVNRVGTSVASTYLDIGDKKNAFVISQLDLRKLFKLDPTSLYLISLSFQKEDMLYTPLKQDNKDDYDYYGDDYYSNPMSYGYFETHGRVYKPIVSSDIGLSWIQGANKAIVYSADLVSAKPMAGVSLKFYSYQNQVVGQATTDYAGRAELPATSEAFYMTGEKNGQRSFVTASEMAWDLSSFNTGGSGTAGTGTKAFVFTDRGVYRPGELVNMTIILRNPNGSYPDAAPVSVKVYDPKGKLSYENNSKAGTDGFYNFAFSTKEDDPTGSYYVEIVAGGASFSKEIKVETVVANRLKVEIKTDKESLVAGDKALSIDIDSSYLFGAPASGLYASLSGTLRNRDRSFPSFPGYSFSASDRVFQEAGDTLFSDNLDEKGSATVKWQIPEGVTNAPSALSLVLYASVSERGGRATGASKIVPIDPWAVYAGYKMPDFKWGWAQINEKVQVPCVAVDAKSEKALAGRTMTWNLYKGSRYWWWEYDSYYSYHLRFKKDRSTTKVASGTIVTKETPVLAEFNPKDYGEYYFELVDAQGHSSGFFFYASSWGESTGSEDSGQLALKADKITYAPGETATVSFPAPESGAIIIGIHKGGEILSTEWKEIGPAIRDSSGTARIKIPLSAQMLPNVYATISIIQPHSQSSNDRPLRLYGVIPISVTDAGSRQDIEIISPDSLKPNEEFTVKVRTKDGKPTQLSLAVVDEGLLSLTNFKSPDPWSFFYAKESLSVRLADLYSLVIGAFTQDFLKTFAIGGGGGEDEAKSMEAPAMAKSKAEIAAAEEQKRFSAVAFFSGPVMTDATGQATFKWTMPNYLGQVRMMAVSAKGSRYGSAEKYVTVNTPLVILPTLPRVLGPGEEFRVPVGVFAMKPNMGKVTVTAQVSGPANLIGSFSQVVDLSTRTDADTYFTIRTTMATGKLKVTIQAKAGNESSSQTTYIDVRAAAAPEYRSDRGTIRAGETKAYTIPSDGLPGTVRSAVTVSLKAPLDLGRRMRWLIQYPYGCIEQTVSAVFPQLYLKDFMKTKDYDLERIDININEAIARLSKFQLTDGGLSYWPGSTEVSTWGTNYAFHFLVEAKRLGYSVPNDLLANILKFSNARALANQDDALTQAYRLYLLAISGEKVQGPLNLLRETSLKGMDDVKKWLLAASYSALGQDDAAKSILATTGTSVKDYSELYGTYGSGLRDTAIILECAMRLNRMDIADKVFDSMSTVVSNDYWYSTQTLGYSLMAMGKYIEKIRSSGSPKIVATIQVEGEAKPIQVNVNAMSSRFDLSQYAGKKVTVTAGNGSSVDRIGVSFEWEGVPLKSAGSDLSKNLAIDIAYYDLNGKAMKGSPPVLTQGDSMWIVYTVTKKFYSGKDADLHNMALTQILPSGWEIENLRLTGEAYPDWISRDASGNSRYLSDGDYMDMRDDRVSWFFPMYWGYYSQCFAIKVRAVTAGTFTMPQTVLEAMYSQEYRAQKAGGIAFVKPKQ